MAEEGSLPIDYKNLHELRVVDLKKELEKRGLSKSGSKKELVDRLKTQLKIEELREKSKSSVEGVSAQAPSIQLSDGGHNEIVKNYLQQREKLYEQQMEQKKKYQEEASRSQESESQSETDDGTSSQMKSEKQEQVETSKLSDIEEDDTDGKNKDAEAEASRAAAAEEVSDQKSKDVSHTEALDKTGERRSRSRSGSSRSRSSSTASSRSAERSQISSRPTSEAKSTEAAPGPTKPSPQRVARSRSPSVEEVRSGSSSPESRSPRSAQPPRTVPPVSQRSQSPPTKKIRRSRSASSTDSEDEEKPRIAQKRRGSRDSTPPHRSGSESSRRSSPLRSKASRPRSSSSDGSSVSPPPRKRVPSGELQQSKKKSRSLSSSGTEDESRGGLPRKSRSRSRSPVNEEEEEEEDAPAGKAELDLKKLQTDRKISILKSVEGENVTTDYGKNRELRRSPSVAEGKGAGDAVEIIHDKIELKVEDVAALDQVNLSQSHEDNDGKGEEIDVKPTRKRRWGSTTLKTITSQPSVNISTESLKAMIPEMKGSVLLPELLPELDNPSPEPQNHQDASQTKTTEEAEKDEGDATTEATPGSVAEDGAVKRQISFKSQESVKQKGQDSVKQKGQESVKLKRTIFQVVKADDDEYEEDQELTKSSENAVNEESAPEPEAVVESNGRKVVEVAKAVTEQDKKADTSKEVRRINRLLTPAIPVDDPQPVGGRRSPSPAKNLATSIVHIHRLVRPYTLGQLKELLSQTGVIVDDGFWIDKIKSHCLVGYGSVDEAVATRRALHGKRWPLSNPNVLRVEYSTQEEFDMFKNAKDGVLPKPLMKPEELPERKKEERPRPLIPPPKDATARDQEKKEIAKPVARDARPRAKERTPPVREWDRDKIRQSRSRSRDRNRKEEKTAVRGAPPGQRERDREARDASREERRKRRASSQERKEKKAEKVEAEPPAKLLDDLFRKTKAMPCIYWLPLTEEQIAEKVAAQQQMEAERERRRQEREQMQVEEEREQKGVAARARDDRGMAKENKRDDRRPDRRDRSTDAKPKEPEPDGGVKRSGAPGVSGGRNDRAGPRR